MPKCTYCGGTEWYEGPSGGMSVNILCANENCRHWFNHTPMLDELDDLKRVEPTAEEKTAEQAKRRAEADAAREARFEEGRKAFYEGKPMHTLRVDPAYGGYAEPKDNIDRICGYVEVMAKDVQSLMVARGIREIEKEVH